MKSWQLIDTLVESIQVFLKEMTEEQRVDFFEQIKKGYCIHCGERSVTCQCTNDE